MNLKMVLMKQLIPQLQQSSPLLQLWYGSAIVNKPDRRKSSGNITKRFWDIGIESLSWISTRWRRMQRPNCQTTAKNSTRRRWKYLGLFTPSKYSIFNIGLFIPLKYSTGLESGWECVCGDRIWLGEQHHAGGHHRCQCCCHHHHPHHHQDDHN